MNHSEKRLADGLTGESSNLGIQDCCLTIGRVLTATSRFMWNRGCRETNESVQQRDVTISVLER